VLPWRSSTQSHVLHPRSPLTAPVGGAQPWAAARVFNPRPKQLAQAQQTWQAQQLALAQQTWQAQQPAQAQHTQQAQHEWTGPSPRVPLRAATLLIDMPTPACALLCAPFQLTVEPGAEWTYNALGEGSAEISYYLAGYLNAFLTMIGEGGCVC